MASVISSPPMLTVGERRHANFAQQTRALMVLTDIEGRIVWVNEAFTRVTGYNLDEAVGRSPGELLQGAETDPQTIRYMAEALSKGRGFEVEILNYTRDGVVFWLDLEAQPVYDESGNVVEFISMGHDITARKRAEAARSERERVERRGAMAADLVSNPVVITDVSGYIEWVNSAFIRITGYTAAEVIGRRPGSLLHGPETDPRTVERMRRAVQRREPCEVEVVNYTKLGRRYWVAIEIRPMVDPDTREVNGFIATETDITMQKVAEAALRKSEAEAREVSLVANLFDIPMAMEELDGTIRWVNEAWLRLYGYERHEAIGRRAPELLDGAGTDPDVRSQVDQACARGERMRFAIVNYRKDGSQIDVIVERRPVRDERGLINRAVTLMYVERRKEPVAMTSV